MADLDKHALDQAQLIANNDAELYGFKIGSDKWKESLKGAIAEAKETMSIGREKNPRYLRNPVASVSKYFTAMFAKDASIAKKLAQNYTSPDGKSVPTEVVQNRILAAVTSLVKLYENAELGTVNTTKGHKQGRIENTEMSALQLPERTKSMTDEEYRKLKLEVIKNWITRDLLTGILIELITPFFMMTKKDVADILNSVNFDVDKVENYQTPSKEVSEFGHHDSPRDQFIKALHARLGKRLTKLNLREVLTGLL